MRSLVEGNTLASSEIWKQVAKRFQSEQGEPISVHDLHGGFFLSCLLTLVSAQYDMQALSKHKNIFVDEGIISAGFVKTLLPKVKGYYRFRDETVQLCKHSEKSDKTYESIVQSLQLRQAPLPEYVDRQSRKYILGYLSDFLEN